MSKAHYAAKSTFGGSLRDLLYGNTFFGDPAMVVWTYDPGLLKVDLPPILYRDIIQTVSLIIRDNQTQIGLSNVLVTLSKGNEVYDRGLTDVSGHVSLTSRPDTEGHLKVVCTRPNFISFTDSIIVKTYCDSAIAGDANGDNVLGNGDVTFLSCCFKGLGTPPPDSCMCTEGTSFLYHAGDANGNCEFRGSDLTYLVAYFKGQAPAPHFCTTCPLPNPFRFNIIPTVKNISLTK